MTEAEKIAYYTNKIRFPNKDLVDGSISMMKRLPSGDWARVRLYPNGLAKWTWNFDQNGVKRDIVGKISRHDFYPFSAIDYAAIDELYERQNDASQGIMAVA